MAAEIKVTPTLDTSAYASGDRLGSVMTLTSPAIKAGVGAKLEDVIIIDAAVQSQAIDILFFEDSPTIASADNAAIDFTDTQALKLIGSVSFLAADYKATASNSYAHKAGLGMWLTPKSASSLYALLVCRSGTPTYAATSLTLKFKFS